jgi:hypothetical protein
VRGRLPRGADPPLGRRVGRRVDDELLLFVVLCVVVCVSVLGVGGLGWLMEQWIDRSINWSIQSALSPPLIYTYLYIHIYIHTHTHIYIYHTYLGGCIVVGRRLEPPQEGTVAQLRHPEAAVNLTHHRLCVDVYIYMCVCVYKGVWVVLDFCGWVPLSLCLCLCLWISRIIIVSLCVYKACVCVCMGANDGANSSRPQTLPKRVTKQRHTNGPTHRLTLSHTHVPN